MLFYWILSVSPQRITLELDNTYFISHVFLWPLNYCWQTSLEEIYFDSSSSHYSDMSCLFTKILCLFSFPNTDKIKLLRGKNLSYFTFLGFKLCLIFLWQEYAPSLSFEHYVLILIYTPEVYRIPRLSINHRTLCVSTKQC